MTEKSSPAPKPIATKAKSAARAARAPTPSSAKSGLGLAIKKIEGDLLRKTKPPALRGKKYGALRAFMSSRPSSALAHLGSFGPFADLPDSGPEARLTARLALIDLYKSAYRSSTAEQHAQLIEGLPAKTLGELSDILGMPLSVLGPSLGLPGTTIRRRLTGDERLALDESEHTLGLIRLIGQVQDMVECAGDPQGFDAGAWVRDWLNEPSPALGGALPREYLSSNPGQQALSDLLMRNISGAYA